MIDEFGFWSEGIPVLDTGGDADFGFWYEGVPFLDEVGHPPVIPTGRPDPIAWPTTLPVPLLPTRFASRGSNMAVLFESGRTRTRRTFLTPLETLDVQWNFTEDQFNTFKTFFDVTLNNGATTILIEIYGVEKEMAFQESNYAFSRSDNLFSVTATLEYIDAS